MEKTNKCNQCDFAFFRAGKLREHLNMHSAKQMQTMWLRLFSCRAFKETFKNARWRKVKQMQSASSQAKTLRTQLNNFDLLGQKPPFTLCLLTSYCDFISGLSHRKHSFSETQRQKKEGERYTSWIGRPMQCTGKWINLLLVVLTHCYSVWFGLVWLGMIWFNLLLHSLVRPQKTKNDLVWFDFVLFDSKRHLEQTDWPLQCTGWWINQMTGWKPCFGLVWFGIVWFGLVWSFLDLFCTVWFGSTPKRQHMTGS